ncbi:hypothetical protein M406DRAFT_292368 [Cryphonectria parasitica EP155]|uniref:Uncharacterized protein n=1 Tax=Cryphonectria parasitica (strain ATCC 38755 / EP155) TaxID=660469 RepID=A0A9P4Y231_CRYP1|nr:uncharacterized protein M406DRAFT_292368 [Cryphonectria parasitica EP155]KAF3765089.1 hypothetical protein M406DRAFT_292368 [Cryphonectria parasitica EP155]
MSIKATPVITTGIHEEIGRAVIDQLKPEYEVIHLALLSNVENELPFLLKNQAPPSPSSSLGTGNWDSPPRAILFGGGYTDEIISRLQELAASTEGARQIPWLRVDAAKVGLTPGSPEFIIAITKKFKAELERLKTEGRLEDDGKDHGGVVWV